MLNTLRSCVNSLLAKYKAYRDHKQYQKALNDLDRRIDSTFQTCFMLFRPSFYATHTPEETEKATKESLERINKLLEETFSFLSLSCSIPLLSSSHRQL